MKQLIYFTANWCSACQGMSPIIQQLQTSKTIPVAKIDTDYDANYVEKYNVRNIPTIILLENGQETRRHTGALSSQQLNNFING
jgi:thioredoxin-like negative regulator of GroEL